jgi:excisionase family DNA binding protein
MGEIERATTTVHEAARRLGIGRSAAYEAVRNGTIPSVRIGARYLIPIRRFEAWLNERDVE